MVFRVPHLPHSRLSLARLMFHRSGGNPPELLQPTHSAKALSKHMHTFLLTAVQISQSLRSVTVHCLLLTWQAIWNPNPAALHCTPHWHCWHHIAVWVWAVLPHAVRELPQLHKPGPEDSSINRGPAWGDSKAWHEVLKPPRASQPKETLFPPRERLSLGGRVCWPKAKGRVCWPKERGRVYTHTDRHSLSPRGEFRPAVKVSASKL